MKLQRDALFNPVDLCTRTYTNNWKTKLKEKKAMSLLKMWLASKTQTQGCIVNSRETYFLMDFVCFWLMTKPFFQFAQVDVVQTFGGIDGQRNKAISSWGVYYEVQQRQGFFQLLAWQNTTLPYSEVTGTTKVVINRLCEPRLGTKNMLRRPNAMHTEGSTVTAGLHLGPGLESHLWL